MRALIQRVSSASVQVDAREVARIGRGLLVLLGVAQADQKASAEAMARRLLAYRVFADEEGRMNLDVRQAGGGLLVVSQFTLVADTRRGLRPSFTPAAAPAQAEHLYEHLLHCLRAEHQPVASGEFAAMMQVSLVNDGPVTFLLET